MSERAYYLVEDEDVEQFLATQDRCRKAFWKRHTAFFKSQFPEETLPPRLTYGRGPVGRYEDNESIPDKLPPGWKKMKKYPGCVNLSLSTKAGKEILKKWEEECPLPPFQYCDTPFSLVHLETRFSELPIGEYQTTGAVRARHPENKKFIWCIYCDVRVEPIPGCRRILEDELRRLFPKALPKVNTKPKKMSTKNRKAYADRMKRMKEYLKSPKTSDTK